MSTILSEGFLAELFASLQGEGGTVRGSCFGKRQIFIRFSGCNLAESLMDSNSCLWCDSPSAQFMNVPHYKYETLPGSKNMIRAKNPVKIERIIELVKNLITPDLHSISFTGGEPTLQTKFIKDLALGIKKELKGIPLYLETNGCLLAKEPQIKELAERFTYCCCDIKDRSSNARFLGDWESLVDTEITFIKNMIRNGVLTFGKIVVTSKTQLSDIKAICKRLAEIKYPDGQSVGLAIQPVYTELKKMKENIEIKTDYLNEIFYTSAEHLNPNSLTLSVQTHKFLDLL